jgi:hypothetical protein
MNAALDNPYTEPCNSCDAVDYDGDLDDAGYCRACADYEPGDTPGYADGSRADLDRQDCIDAGRGHLFA